MTIEMLLDAVEDAITHHHLEAEGTRWWARWRTRKHAALWLSGRAAALPALGVTAIQQRQTDGGEVEYGYTLRQAEKIRARLLEAFRAHYTGLFQS